MDILLAVIMGGLFGFALYFVGASIPSNLLSMLRLQNMTLMKIILFAIGFSSVLLFAAEAVGLFDVSHINIKSVNLGVIIGGLIFGIGFGAAGTCPGTCVAAAGSGGFKKALVVIFGGLVGAFAFSITYGFWKGAGLFANLDFGKLTLFDISSKYDSVFGLGYVGLLISGMVFIIISLVLPERILGRK